MYLYKCTFYEFIVTNAMHGLSNLFLKGLYKWGVFTHNKVSVLATVSFIFRQIQCELVYNSFSTLFMTVTSFGGVIRHAYDTLSTFFSV